MSLQLRPTVALAVLLRSACLLLALAAPLRAAEQVAQVPAETAPGGVIRVLDKISGETTDIEIARGQTRVFGRLSIVLGDCRYPTRDPNSDAWAWLEIRDDSMDEAAFSGWMVASSPALNALDHPRYDVWVLRCSNT